MVTIRHYGVSLSQVEALAAIVLAWNGVALGQQQPLPIPAITGPLTAAPPHTLDAGPFSKLAVNGILDGLGVWTGNYMASDESGHAAVGNAQVFIQRTESWFQFYLQAGAYNIPALGVPFFGTGETVTHFYGPVPVGFLKLQPAKNTSFLIGALPTLFGAEYTFTFENMNVARGLLWNQENAINRGIQLNQTIGNFSVSLSWNDGFYSNRFTWLSGSLAYANGPHTFTFVAGGNYSQTEFQNLATLVQNNSRIYDVIYTYNKGSWVVQAYFQHTNVPANKKIDISEGNATQAGAILVNHTFSHGFSLPLRWEYITSTGDPSKPDIVNLLYGPGSRATSITITPTFQHRVFFVRADLSYVRASHITPGFAFGQGGNLKSQPRAIAEFGFLF